MFQSFKSEKWNLNIHVVYLHVIVLLLFKILNKCCSKDGCWVCKQVLKFLLYYVLLNTFRNNQRHACTCFSVRNNFEKYLLNLYPYADLYSDTLLFCCTLLFCFDSVQNSRKFSILLSDLWGLYNMWTTNSYSQRLADSVLTCLVIRTSSTLSDKMRILDKTCHFSQEPNIKPFSPVSLCKKKISERQFSLFVARGPVGRNNEPGARNNMHLTANKIDDEKTHRKLPRKKSLQTPTCSGWREMPVEVRLSRQIGVKCTKQEI